MPAPTTIIEPGTSFRLHASLWVWVHSAPGKGRRRLLPPAHRITRSAGSLRPLSVSMVCESAKRALPVRSCSVTPRRSMCHGTQSVRARPRRPTWQLARAPDRHEGPRGASRQRIRTAAGRPGVDGVLTLGLDAARAGDRRRADRGGARHLRLLPAGAARGPHRPDGVRGRPAALPQGYLPVVFLAERARYGLFPAQGEVDADRAELHHERERRPGRAAEPAGIR